MIWAGLVDGMREGRDNAGIGLKAKDKQITWKK
jgi:hypothetical protein